jgi:hypothetical protein
MEAKEATAKKGSTMNEPTIETSAVDKVSAALVACQGALKPAEFDASNPFFKSRYASLGAVIAASREALAKHGLAILQRPTIVGDLVSVQTTIIHSSGQTLDGGTMSLTLEGSDRNSDAQIAGSILTYLKRYAWASVLGIYADSDDDGNSAPKQAQGAKPLQRGTPPSQNAPTGTPATPKATLEATDKHRMRALNVLHAAPGQDNRGLVERWLRSKLWIHGEQTCEDWTLAHVPTTTEAMQVIMNEVTEFERTQSNQAGEQR